eukprot:Nitzschia sp. Nitz4//scaffold199_size41809//22222//23514//NITZ4_007454-RA/size41809-processed-gene-0.33-mRNA-1//-1//CDS//3329540573//2380//frame0
MTGQQQRTRRIHFVVASFVGFLFCSYHIYSWNVVIVSNINDHEHTKSNKNNVTSPFRKLLLSVPFYVYDDIPWVNATYGDERLELNALSVKNPKHYDDFFFMKAALKHPMRTLDPTQAKLFVIPSLQNMFDSRSYFKDKDLCVGEICNKQLMQLAADFILNSTSFKKYPERHIAMASHYARHEKWWKGKLGKSMPLVLWDSHNIGFENKKTNSPNRCSFPKLHVGTACSLQNKTEDVTMIASLKPNDDRYHNRFSICSWIHLQNHSNVSVEGSVPALRSGPCGWGETCPALARAKLGFHARGDTLGSNRLMDTILSGTVPIFTLRKQYDILPDFIEFERISYFIDMKKVQHPDSFLHQLEAILQDTDTYGQKLDLILQHRHLFDWHTLHPFDLYLYRLQVQLYPDTAHPLDFYGTNETIVVLHPNTNATH